jgi:hypothetical protein
MGNAIDPLIGVSVPAALALGFLAVGFVQHLAGRRRVRVGREELARREAAGCLSFAVRVVDAHEQPVQVGTCFDRGDLGWDTFVATSSHAVVEDERAQRFGLAAGVMIDVRMLPGIVPRFVGETKTPRGTKRLYSFEMHPRRPFWISAIPTATPDGPFRDRPVRMLAPFEGRYLVGDARKDLEPVHERPWAPLIGSSIVALLASAVALVEDVEPWGAGVGFGTLVLVILVGAILYQRVLRRRHDSNRPGT